MYSNLHTYAYILARGNNDICAYDLRVLHLYELLVFYGMKNTIITYWHNTIKTY